jgi:hypothetical protein
VRNEFKKKTGIAIDEHGNRKEVNTDGTDGTDGGGGIRLITNSSSASSNADNGGNLDHALLNKNKVISGSGPNANVILKKEYKPITSYKPTGNLVYSNDFLKKIDERINN